MLYIKSPELIHFKTEKLVYFDQLLPFPLPPQPLATTTTLSASTGSTLDSTYKIMQYLSFCIWNISLSLMSCRFTHIIAHGRISFFFKAE